MLRVRTEDAEGTEGEAGKMRKAKSGSGQESDPPESGLPVAGESCYNSPLVYLCMKRLGGLAIILVLVLAGCSRPATGPGTVAKASGTPADPATAKPDAAATEPGHAGSFVAQTRPLITSEDVPLLEQINRENVRVVAAASPSVVRVTAVGPVDPHSQLFGNLPFKIPGLPQNFRPVVPSYGSGVIISKDGYIVTNNHVISDSQTVVVQLRDQRSFPGAGAGVG